MKPTRIRVISICLFRHRDRVLVLEGYDTVKRDWYYRPLGGAIEPGETAEQALNREILEELHQEITGVRLLTVLENIFTCDGMPGHEVVFVFDADFADRSIYGRTEMTITDDGGASFRTLWRAPDCFDATHRLVPEGLMALLQELPDRR